MKIILIFITICHSTLLCAQQKDYSKEVHFETNLTWDKVKEKAKREKKYIFVDYYATWCAPCKEMDKLVYPADMVADFVNIHFISVKVQMDTSKKDDEQIIRWYPVAQFFKEQFKIGEFPTYLFFNSDGQIVHRDAGFKVPDEFLKVTKEAIDPKRQVYSLLDNYKNGRKNYKSMPELAMKTYNLLHDREMASKIAEDYNKNYLNNLPDERLLNKESIEFINWYPRVLNSTDRYFKLFYHNSKQVDSVMNKKGFASEAVDGVITMEEIFSRIYKDGKPVSRTANWKQLSGLIQKKYTTDIAERNILNAQITWYTYKKDWKNSVKYNVEKIEKYEIDTSFWGRFHLNNMIWEIIFKHSNDRKILNNAIIWIETILVAENYKNPASIDTYANLLFKVGRVADAIKWQTTAVSLSPDDQEIQDHLEKMKRKEPTWPAQ